LCDKFITAVRLCIERRVTFCGLFNDAIS
jgi:hypothetical protein